MRKTTSIALAMIFIAPISFAQSKAPLWRSVEASNGQKYMVNIASVQRFENGASYANGVLSATAFMYEDQGDSNSINRQRMYIFDCHGHVQDATSMHAATYIPPRSVAAKIAALVCAQHPPSSTSHYVEERTSSSGRSPAEYCVGFSSEACERMQAQINSKRVPVACKPGFAIAGDPANVGLSPEQLRVCYMMTQ